MPHVSPEQARAAAPLSQKEVRAIIIGILLAMFLAALDQTIVATALPTIGRELGDVEHLPWVVTAYLLASTAVTPLYGKLSDIHGRRVMLLVGIAIFLVGSLACALAPTMLVADPRRAALQGIGGGGLISLAQTIIADIVSPEGAAALPGLYRRGLRDVEHRRPGARRLLRRASALVDDLLDQPAARPPRLADDRRAAQEAAAARAAAPARLARRRPDGAGDRRLLLLALSWGGVRYPWASAPILGLVGGSAVLWLLSPPASPRRRSR